MVALRHLIWKLLFTTCKCSLNDIMSMKLRAVSGTYNVRASEAARSENKPTFSKLSHYFVCFLDGSKAVFETDKRAKASVLLNQVFDHLELVEKDYFGLQYPDIIPDSMRWLDPNKSLKKQLRISPPYQLIFRVKFYVSDPSKLHEEYTRYHIFLQVKKDILEGLLPCSPHSAFLLAGLAAQSELGDWSPEEHKPEYLANFQFIPGQSNQFEAQVSELHRGHRGLSPAQAEALFLDHARKLEMYGVHLFKATWDLKDIEILLGVCASGLVVFENNHKIDSFAWSKIIKLSFKRKQFYIQLRLENTDTLDNMIVFNMISYRSCKNLWKSCVEHHTFFRLHSPQSAAKKYFFALSSKFRYSGRTEYQTLEDSKRKVRVERSFSRSLSRRFARRTVGGTTREVILEERNSIDGLRNSVVRLPTSNTTPCLSSNQEIVRRKASAFPISPSHPSFNQSSPLRATLPSDYRHAELIDRKAWSEGKLDDERAVLPSSSLQLTCSAPSSSHLNAQDKSAAYSVSPIIPIGDDGLCTVRMKPDQQGRFGFNVKGGADQSAPIIVSRVAHGSPADICIPRLNEGDQVLYINGRDISSHNHEQVVMFIRASRESHSGELTLIVRPNVYIGEDSHCDDDTSTLRTSELEILPKGADPLQASLVMLQESLESGSALAQFEQLFRRKSSFTMHAARLPNNVTKNRYRDISPYDQTRVVLQDCDTGDYINANYVNMEIPGSGVVNRYVASQGPLPHTCYDYWSMIWQLASPLIVMLTAQIERGRVKCHQYWPSLHKQMEFGMFEVRCIQEDATNWFAIRELTVINKMSGERRNVQQMQYVAWPDHGVPEDSSQFLEFVTRVRDNRVGIVEPTVVHCSAGIGRTGVLITMETAMCLIEANQKVVPLDIVREMRLQRAMLIQTVTQYKFVCEAILRAYNEKLVLPLDDYQR